MATAEDSSEDREPQDVRLNQIANRLLDRYVAVWLWSLVFGTTIALAYSYVNYRGDRWGILAVLPISLLVVGGVIVGAALVAQIRFLSKFLLPVFFGRYDASVSEPDPQYAARLIARSTRWLLYGFLVRGALAIAETSLGALRGGF